jgi:hypothetical protein
MDFVDFTISFQVSEILWWVADGSPDSTISFCSNYTYFLICKQAPQKCNSLDGYKKNMQNTY